MRLASLCSVLLVAACGGSSPATADGPAADTAEPGPGGAVRVTVTQAGVPVGGLSVYFLDPNNTVVAMTTTDATGRASATLHAGGSVTVVHAPLASGTEVRDLESWVGVQPGDDLALELPSFHAAMNLMVSVPVASLPDVASYNVVSPCGGTGLFLAGQTIQLSLLPNCVVDPLRSDFIAFAQDASGQAIAAFVALQVGISSGQHLALTGAYQPVADIPIAYANIGPTQSIELGAFAITGAGPLQVANPYLSATGGSIAGTFHWPAQLTTGTRVLEAGLLSPDSPQRVTSWAPVASSVSVDLMDQVGQPITSQATIDPSHRQLAWTLADHGAPAHLAVASLTVDQGASKSLVWTIVAPGAAPQIALPQLPGSIIQFPSPGTTGVGLTLLRVPGGTASWTRVLGTGGYYAGFAGLFSASPSGSMTQVFPPVVPL